MVSHCADTGHIFDLADTNKLFQILQGMVILLDYSQGKTRNIGVISVKPAGLI